MMLRGLLDEDIETITSVMVSFIDTLYGRSAFSIDESNSFQSDHIDYRPLKECFFFPLNKPLSDMRLHLLHIADVQFLKSNWGSIYNGAWRRLRDCTRGP